MTGPWINGPIVDQGAIGITGGSITGVTGTSYTLTKGGIPLIGLSSGSVASNGAISAITALPLVYPAAYCYFPANILAASIAAGWYYCTFSSTTAGVAFLNTYTSGMPAIPASPTAVTAGQGAFTGDTGEEFGLTVTVPAGALGANGALRILYTVALTNNANAKTSRIRLSGNAGVIFASLASVSTAINGMVCEISNAGVNSSQVSQVHGAVSASPSLSNQVGAVDTSVATTLVMSIQRATATDNIVMLPPTVEVLG